MEFEKDVKTGIYAGNGSESVEQGSGKVAQGGIFYFFMINKSILLIIDNKKLKTNFPDKKEH
jgi:hypothetical protein